MKIVSWNINSLKMRLPHIKQFWESQSPDVLMVQELKGLEFPFAAFESMDLHALAVPQKARNGLAVITKEPAQIIHEKLPGFEEDEQARYLEFDYAGIRMINIYAPNGNPVDTEKFPYKLEWLEHLTNRLNALRSARTPFLIGGDFNIIPEDKDCHDPKAWQNDALFQPESRRFYRRMLNLGLTDAFRVLNTAPENYTFWDYQRGAWEKNNGIRIDHFLLSPEITDRLTACEIDAAPRGWQKPSDHTPIIITLTP